MPIQLVAGRAQNYLAPPPTAPAQIPAASAQAASGAGQAIDSGAISGGKLRPGAIDQMTFQQRMMALNRADPPATLFPGGAGRSPVAGPAPLKSAPAIPTLTPAQLAALGVDVSGLDFTTPPAETPPAPAAAAELPASDVPASDVPANAVPSGDVAAGEPSASDPPAGADPAAATATAQAQGPAAGPQQASVDPDPAEADAAARANAPMPGAHLGKDGIWELPRQPGKDEREWLAGMNAKWRIVENPESVKLFLGADGKFGFDDFLDIINPLQHIPLLNIAYRDLTGDTIDGAAQLLGAIPFGPLSVASNVSDLAFRAETGAGLAENGLAMLFGTGKAAPGGEEIATASGRVSDPLQIRRGSNR